ncbi:RES domain-containing protein [Mycobacterium sp. Y57]|uniref:RES domain-containing protein n=1 Tax=Mycolicibacterium xanthum TaxID=2796469 RepID=UPI001C85DA09|nr:RES domain-containing protein [Mycolicibacterium xanthum]MBX7432570.1 RES domain-containing protein [Mycolicibacterium xanthum]
MPELPAGYLAPLPDGRPFGLRRTTLKAGTEFWRLDATAPADWDWRGFPEPRYRFDPESGSFRTRYAGATLAGAVRERYRASGLVIPADHRSHHLVRLVASRNVRALDLRTEKNLDILRLDDQVSTGQHADVWRTCHRLADAVRRWWTDVEAIVYRSRTTPSSSLNVGFFTVDGFDVTSRALGEASEVLADLVLQQGVTVDWDLDA